ncbi:hypothetical protein ACFSC4_20890 [Deinococcus malanensis]|uniref:hypothetical protein n=1 Tax=Deinococcus malanensis TaxID=1706855 RepID=UPI00362956F1
MLGAQADETPVDQACGSAPLYWRLGPLESSLTGAPLCGRLVQEGTEGRADERVRGPAVGAENPVDVGSDFRFEGFEPGGFCWSRKPCREVSLELRELGLIGGGGGLDGGRERGRHGARLRSDDLRAGCGIGDLTGLGECWGHGEQERGGEQEAHVRLTFSQASDVDIRN